MFIEGVTKESNPSIRAECAKGLGRTGPSGFRTLLLALHDHCHDVREAAGSAILRNMSPEAVLSFFDDKEHQKQSVLCSIKEVLMSDRLFDLSGDVYGYMHRLCALFEQEGETGDEALSSQRHGEDLEEKHAPLLADYYSLRQAYP